MTLELFIDRDGRVTAESTRVDEPSGYPALDSAALACAPPGDTILKDPKAGRSG